MPKNTYPNQRMVCVHREPAKADFLGIKNANWQAAARDLRPFAFLLYLYLASNANNYTLALSPAAVQEAVGMARNTYHDQFRVLLSKGYLVQRDGNTFDFYEVPQPRAVTQQKNTMSEAVLNFDECTAPGSEEQQAVQVIPQDGIEINNNENQPNTGINNNSHNSIYVPKVKEIVIPRPTVKPKEPAKAEFYF